VSHLVAGLKVEIEFLDRLYIHLCICLCIYIYYMYTYLCIYMHIAWFILADLHIIKSHLVAGLKVEIEFLNRCALGIRQREIERHHLFIERGRRNAGGEVRRRGPLKVPCPTCWTREAQKKILYSISFSLLYEYINLNVYVSMSYTGLHRRNALFIFVWLRHRNTWIPVRHVGALCA